MNLRKILLPILILAVLVLSFGAVRAGNFNASQVSQSAVINTYSNENGTVSVTFYQTEFTYTGGASWMWATYVPGFYSADSAFTINSNTYSDAIVFYIYAANNRKITPAVAVILQNGNEMTVTLDSSEIIDVSGNTNYVFILQNHPSWADNQAIVSARLVSFTIIDPANAITDVVTVNESYHSITSAAKLVFTTFTIIQNDYYSYIMNAIDNVQIDSFETDAGGIVEMQGNMNSLTISASRAFLLAEIEHYATISIKAFDALNKSEIPATIVIDGKTYTGAVTVWTGTYEVTVTASNYRALTTTITATVETQYNFNVEILPTTAIYSIAMTPTALAGYEKGVYTAYIVISPVSTFSNNVSMIFVGWPFQPTLLENGTIVSGNGNQYYLGAVNTEKTFTLVVSFDKATQAVAQINIVANDAFTSTASMAYSVIIEAKSLPFYVTTPQVWIYGGNMLRIQNDTQTITSLYIHVTNKNVEIYNIQTSMTPLQVISPAVTLSSGVNTIVMTFVIQTTQNLALNLNDSNGNQTVYSSAVITFYATANEIANADYSTLTVTYDVVNTAEVTVTNPFAAVGTFTVFIAGNWGTESASKVVAVLPNSTMTVPIFFNGPTNREISAYEASIWVVYSDNTVFNTTVPVTATTKPGILPAGISQNDLIYIGIGLLVIIILVIAIRRGDEL